MPRFFISYASLLRLICHACACLASSPTIVDPTIVDPTIVDLISLAWACLAIHTYTHVGPVLPYTHTHMLGLSSHTHIHTCRHTCRKGSHAEKARIHTCLLLTCRKGSHTHASSSRIHTCLLLPLHPAGLTVRSHVTRRIPVKCHEEKIANNARQAST